MPGTLQKRLTVNRPRSDDPKRWEHRAILLCLIDERYPRWNYAALARRSKRTRRCRRRTPGSTRALVCVMAATVLPGRDNSAARATIRDSRARTGDKEKLQDECAQTSSAGVVRWLTIQSTASQH